MASWEEEFFPHRLSLVRFDRTAKQPLVVAGSPFIAYFETTPDKPSETNVGKQPTTFDKVEDQIHIPLCCPAQNGDYILQTVGPDVNSSSAWWDVRSYPKERSELANKQVVTAMRRDNAPEGWGT